MKRFYIKAFVFAFTVSLTCILLDYAITSGLKRNNQADMAVWNTIYKGEVNSEIIINGSSRAVFHIDPVVVSNVLNKNCYNFGMDGQMFEIQYCRYKVFLEHNPPPKVVIHSMDCHTLCKTEGLYNYQQFLPYLKDSTLKNTLINFQGLSKNDYFVPMSRYAGEYKIMAQGLKLFAGASSAPDRKRGFEGHDYPWNNDLEEAKKMYPDKLQYKLDSGVIKQFEEYIQDCKKRNIKLILVYSPEYVEGQSLIRNRKDIIALYDRFAQKYEVPFLNYSQSPFCTNRDFFYNALHLNARGAEKFSELLAKDIKALDTNTLLRKHLYSLNMNNSL